MLHLIDELKVIPGVIGAGICHSDQGLKASNLPAIFKVERLAAVGLYLQKLYASGQVSLTGLTDVSVAFDESVIVARDLGGGFLVFVVCDPSFNHNLLSVSLSLLKEDFLAAGFVVPQRTEPKPAVDTPGAPSTLEELAERDPELMGLLSEIKAALARSVGPLAAFIFDEVFEEWALEGASIDRVELLCEGLIREIDDEERAEQCRTAIFSAVQNRKAR